MHRWLAFVPTFLLALAPIGHSQPTRAPERAVLVDRALDLERKQLWQQAADLYQRALRYYPDDAELRDRWHTAEQIYSLSRRYHDVSFQADLLTLPESEALALYREVLSKIQTHYVREVHLRDLVMAGYRTLDLALDRPVFQATNLSGLPAETLKLLDAKLEQAARSVGVIRTLGDAAAQARRASRICAAYGCKHSAAAILEFTSGACETLDPYSTQLSPNRLLELYSIIDGNFVGLGIEVRGEDGGLRIIEVLPDSPAQAAGLKDGETIIAIDGVALAGLNSEDAANRLQGKEGSSVRLDVRGAESERAVDVVRREVIVHSVREARMLDVPGTGYIRIESFQKNTLSELEAALADLDAKGMQNLIIDLRGNPGGLLDVSLDVVNLFIGEGVLVSTKGRAWGQNWSHNAKPGPVRALPLAVLVDGDSASASEIFASAIQDHRRGVVVGTRSYGKGSVQSIFPLSTAQTGLRLTTALFFSPDGKRLQNVGIEPDVVVHRGEDSLGEEPPIPRNRSLATDSQLRAAVESFRPLQAVRAN